MERGREGGKGRGRVRDAERKEGGGEMQRGRREGGRCREEGGRVRRGYIHYHGLCGW